MAAMSSAFQRDRSVPFGKYGRKRLLDAPMFVKPRLVRLRGERRLPLPGRAFWRWPF
jgi:hypothetical protein